MTKKSVIHTPHAPAAVGPYSQGIRVGAMIYTAGQLGLDPETGEFAGASAAAQTRQAMRNIVAILQVAGSDVSHIIKTTIYVTDLADFQAINEVYGGFFEDAPPARSTVEVAALPLGGRVEIEVVALVAPASQ